MTRKGTVQHFPVLAASARSVNQSSGQEKLWTGKGIKRRMSYDIGAEEVRSWQEFLNLVNKEFQEGEWCFRGVLDNWSLKTSIERMCESWGLSLDRLPSTEHELVRDFQRRYPALATPPPPSEDMLAWLALMQHHGAPTRLLDWTYSPFVAAYFAFEALLWSDPKDRRRAAIWAMRAYWLNEQTEAILPKRLKKALVSFNTERDRDSFNELFVDAKPRRVFVYPVNPHRLNERLIIQQGLFLCPGNISQPFEENLKGLKGSRDKHNVRKFCFPRATLDDALTGLQSMNMNSASLFPGFDGYAKSLNTRLRFLMDSDKRGRGWIRSRQR